jgi:hypothetical protein
VLTIARVIVCSVDLRDSRVSLTIEYG